MDKLKEHLSKDKAQYFENLKIPEGHQARFKAKLNRNFGVSGYGKRLLPYAMALAATVALIIVLRKPVKEENFTIPPVLGDVSVELERVELYFTTRMQDSPMPLESDDPLLNKQLLQLEKLDTEYNKLRLVLQQNFGNQHVIDAMIKNYQMRIRIMEQMKKYQEIKNNNPNTTSNES